MCDSESHKSGDFSSTGFFKNDLGVTESTSSPKEKIPKKSIDKGSPFTAFSSFDEGACGEPSEAQHLIIDFTPTKEDECDILMKKCCDFFDYINNRKDLQTLKMKPTLDPMFDSNIVHSDSSQNISSSSSDYEPLPTHMLEKSAVSVLDLVEKDDLIKRAFETKVVASKCSLGLDDYSVDDRGIKNLGKVCACTGICPKCKQKPPKKKKPSAPVVDVVNLCKNLDKWDVEHPKPMESPVGPPPLINAVLQRIEPAD